MNTNNADNTIWICWQHHRRTQELCVQLGIQLTPIITKKKGIPKYLYLVLKTIPQLYKHRKKTIIVQNPSLVLCLLTIIIKPFLRYKFIVDAHNEGIIPFINDNTIFRTLTSIVIKYTPITIVTNKVLAQYVQEKGGVAIVLPDPLPILNNFKSGEKESEGFWLRDIKRVLLICTYAEDEPYEEVFNAIGQIGNVVQLCVTGKQNKLTKNYISSLSKNITLTGFLNEELYWQLLNEADLVIDLTKMPNCLVCGAYESIAVNSLVLLSNDASAKETFRAAAIYCDNNVNSIRETIFDIFANIESYKNKQIQEKTNIEKRWLVMKNNFLRLL